MSAISAVDGPPGWCPYHGNIEIEKKDNVDIVDIKRQIWGEARKCNCHFNQAISLISNSAAPECCKLLRSTRHWYTMWRTWKSYVVHAIVSTAHLFYAISLYPQLDRPGQPLQPTHQHYQLTSQHYPLVSWQTQQPLDHIRPTQGSA
jgi:hypothetical protein